MEDISNVSQLCENKTALSVAPQTCTPDPAARESHLVEAVEPEAMESMPGSQAELPDKAADIDNLPEQDSSLHAVIALEGVINVAELPEPEPYAAADVGADADFTAFSAFLGEYRTRCLFSKNWTLREAALAKTRLLVNEGTWDQSADLDPLCNISRIGIQDKVAQVYLTALALLDDVVHKFSALGFKRVDASSALELALGAIVTKLGDNQPRLRERAIDALTSLSHCRVVGADHVAERVMRSLDRKRPPHNKWRPLATRLEFLRRLVREFGVENSTETVRKGSHVLGLESVIRFVEAHGCASHTFEEVRAAAKDVIVDLFIAASDSDRLRLFEPFLENLRPKQSEEYRGAVERGLQLSKRTGDEAIKTDEESTSQSGVAADPIPLTSSFYAAAAGPINSGPPSASPSPGDEQSMRSEDSEEEIFRDQIMKQLEEKAFSVQEAYEILKVHFGGTSQNPVKENVLAEWVNEVGTDVQNDLSRDRKLWEVATWLFQ